LIEELAAALKLACQGRDAARADYMGLMRERNDLHGELALARGRVAELEAVEKAAERFQDDWNANHGGRLNIDLMLELFDTLRPTAATRTAAEPVADGRAESTIDAQLRTVRAKLDTDPKLAGKLWSKLQALGDDEPPAQPVEPSAPVHTCIGTATTSDGSIPPPCPGCQAADAHYGALESVEPIAPVKPSADAPSEAMPDWVKAANRVYWNGYETANGTPPENHQTAHLCGVMAVLEYGIGKGRANAQPAAVTAVLKLSKPRARKGAK
jgi:hypothetical protein